MVDIGLGKSHPLDFEIEVPNAGGSIELLVEEVADHYHFASNCMSSAGSVGSGGMSYGPGCMSSVGTLGSMGSIVSTGG